MIVSVPIIPWVPGLNVVSEPIVVPGPIAVPELIVVPWVSLPIPIPVVIDVVLYVLVIFLGGFPVVAIPVVPNVPKLLDPVLPPVIDGLELLDLKLTKDPLGIYLIPFA